MAEPQSNFTLIPTEELEKLKASLEEIKVMLKQKKEEDVLSCYIPSEKVRQILNISRKTWFNLRQAKKISYIKIGKAIYIKREDLD
ncbi:MAG TPA: helix-turn-helix domain-containing protein, partial [Bacteroidia bacterium]|nr:helix-turn-helix domain-containing protein [Bacteroidia bacterium]